MARSKKVKTGATYTASLTVLGKTFTASGNAIQEAIAAIKPGNVRGKGILILTSGENRQEKVIPPMMLSRLFGASQGLVREIALKQAAMRFNV